LGCISFKEVISIHSFVVDIEITGWFS
jgi:hypothetical protein